jgi:hypothetical protein
VINPKPKNFQLRLWHFFAIVAFVSFSSWAILRPDTYEKEEVRSYLRYPSYYKIKPVSEQIVILRRHFPKLGSADVSVIQKPLPAGAEGYFAIPRWEKLAPTYHQAVERIVTALKQANDVDTFSVYVKYSPEHLRQTEYSRSAWKDLESRQKNQDILIVPAQFGLRHAGRSVRRARAVMDRREFGLGAFAVGVMLLTHPEQKKYRYNPSVDCAGDEYSPVARGRFGHVPCFSFSDGGQRLFNSHIWENGDGKIRFGTRWFDDADEYYGSASGFLLAEAR